MSASGEQRRPNRLVHETSPYLLQHAHNPVDWYPWGPDALRVAKEQNRPILLSIGYSACHWCHVMERESFESEAIASLMNQHFVCIQVDREERPDLDEIYMQATVAMNHGQGGWPMTVFLTPEQEPFFAGTYFPPEDRWGRPGFPAVLKKVVEYWNHDPAGLRTQARDFTNRLKGELKIPAPVSVSESILDEAVSQFRDEFDERNGGFGDAPKFPPAAGLSLLLRCYRRNGDNRTLQMVTRTLDAMAAGGIYDHIGGGFARYSTDARWLVPHFEKMLYDNALLTLTYLEGYQATGREDFARVAREVLRYVARDMTSPEGAFYSATDADSLAPGGHREEGWFYTWTPRDIEAILGPKDTRAVETYYGLTTGGNFEGRNILYTPRSLDEVAHELKLAPEALRSTIEEAKDTLYAARMKRPAPHRDEKVLTAWNGLMISAYARAALILGERTYAEQAARAADFILRHMRQEGRLLRSYKDRRAALNAYLDDYAFLSAGLLDLYEATHALRWLKEAIGLDAILERSYEDQKQGGYFMTSHDHEALLAREKPAYDGAEPSGNSVQLLNLLRLSELTTHDRYRQRAERTLRTFNERLSKAPAALSEMLLALDFYLDTPKEIVLVTPSNHGEAEPFLAKLRSTFLPNRVLVVSPEGEDLKAQAKTVPFLDGKVARNGKATAYVCERQVCKYPTQDPAVFARQIKEVPRLDGAPDRKE